MLDADEAYFKEHGVPLFSYVPSIRTSRLCAHTRGRIEDTELIPRSHMLDLSEESKEDNIATCAKYFTRMAKMNRTYLLCHSLTSLPSVPSSADTTLATHSALWRSADMIEWLEMEIGITGGEEDGVDNSNVDNAALYTQPEDIFDVYKALAAISPNFSIAAAFGNVHGVYKPGNVVLRPELLGMHQKYAAEQLNNGDDKPLCVLLHVSPTVPPAPFLSARVLLVPDPCLPSSLKGAWRSWAVYLGRAPGAGDAARRSKGIRV